MRYCWDFIVKTDVVFSVHCVTGDDEITDFAVIQQSPYSLK